MLMQTQHSGTTIDTSTACRNFPTRQILIAADHSPPAEWALQTAARLASQFDCDQNVVYVAPPLTAYEPEVGRMKEESDLARLEVDQRAIDTLPGHRAEGRNLRRLLRRGTPADEILATAAQTQPDLLIIGTHGRHGIKRLLLGSVAMDVIRQARCPVLCVSHVPPENLGRRIVVGVDFDEASQLAARWAGALAQQTGGQILLVHAVPPPALTQPGWGLVSEDLMNRHHRLATHLLEQFRAILPPECGVQFQLCDGPASATLAATAKAWHADLVVVGHTIRSTLSRVLMGSTTEGVLRQAECPVACINYDPNGR